MPEHHEIADVLVAVKFAFGEVTSTLVLPDLVMDFPGSRHQYRASGLGHVDLCLSVVGRHGGLWEEGLLEWRPALIKCLL